MNDLPAWTPIKSRVRDQVLHEMALLRSDDHDLLHDYLFDLVFELIAAQVHDQSLLAVQGHIGGANP